MKVIIILVQNVRFSYLSKNYVMNKVPDTRIWCQSNDDDAVVAIFRKGYTTSEQ